MEERKVSTIEERKREEEKTRTGKDFLPFSDLTPAPYFQDLAQGGGGSVLPGKGKVYLWANHENI